MAERNTSFQNPWQTICRLVMLLIVGFSAAGCGLPTWTELTGGNKPEAPLQNPNPPAPVVIQTPTPPPPPKPPTDEEIVAKFQAMKSYELDDSALLNLSQGGEGLAVVEEINLNGSKVTNGGLAHLAKLPNLRQLDVRNSPVDKDGAAAIAAITTLETLKLDGGEMTDEAVQALNPLSELKTLEISNVRLSPGGWSQLTNHPHLETLHINNSNMSDEGLEIIGELKSLKTLLLNSVQITDRGIINLKGLDNLEFLSLGYTSVNGSGFGPLVKAKGLKSMKRLAMDSTPLGPFGAKAIMTMSQLEGLGLGNLGTMRDQDFVPMVKPLKNLHDINISNCKSLSGQAFLAFVGNENITVINASGCDAIDDSGLRHLAKCESLRVLELSGTRCTLNGVQALRRALPEVEIRGFGPLGMPSGQQTGPGNPTEAAHAVK